MIKATIHWLKSQWFALFLTVPVFFVAFIPLLYVIRSAFLEERDIGLGTAFSLDAIHNVYLTLDYLLPLWNAVFLAAIVTAISLIVGVALALVVARTDIGGKPVWETLIIMPLFLSPFTGLISWVALGSERTGFINVAYSGLLRPFFESVPALMNIWTFGGIVWVMLLFFCPYAYLFTLGSLRSMDVSLEEAARASGASYFQVLTRVTIPLSAPAVFASGMLIFVLSAEMYTIPGIIGTPINFTVLPWRMFEDMTVFPMHHAHAAAAGTILLWITVLGIWLQGRFTRQAERFVTVTGKGFRGTPIRLGRFRPFVIAFLLVFTGSAVILPFGALIVMSVMKYSAPMVTPELLTLRHYEQLFASPQLSRALVNTLGLALASGVICVGLGFLISYRDVRKHGIVNRFLAFIGILPVAVPGMIYGVGLLWTYSQTAIYGTVAILLLAYAAKFLPYGIMVSRTGILQLHPDLEQSARISGASPARTMALITMPLMRGTLISIFFFVVLMAIREMSASILLYTNNSITLSVLTWNYMDAGNYQFAAAIGVVQTLIILAIIVITRVLFNVSLQSTMGRAA